MHGVRISGGMHGNRFDAQLFTRPLDAQSDFATVGYEDFVEHAFPRLLDDHERFAIFYWLAIFDEDGFHRTG
jgi:hypothetical protein